jgi:hypothetical protein
MLQYGILHCAEFAIAELAQLNTALVYGNLVWQRRRMHLSQLYRSISVLGLGANKQNGSTS